MDVEKVPKQRWKLVSLLVDIRTSPSVRTYVLTTSHLGFLDMLHLPTEDGRLHTMWEQELLHRVPCDLRPESSTISENEVRSRRTRQR